MSTTDYVRDLPRAKNSSPCAYSIFRSPICICDATNCNDRVCKKPKTGARGTRLRTRADHEDRDREDSLEIVPVSKSLLLDRRAHSYWLTSGPKSGGRLIAESWELLRAPLALSRQLRDRDLRTPPLWDRSIESIGTGADRETNHRSMDSGQNKKKRIITTLVFFHVIVTSCSFIVSLFAIIGQFQSL